LEPKTQGPSVDVWCLSHFLSFSRSQWGLQALWIAEELSNWEEIYMEVGIRRTNNKTNHLLHASWSVTRSPELWVFRILSCFFEHCHFYMPQSNGGDRDKIQRWRSYALESSEVINTQGSDYIVLVCPMSILKVHCLKVCHLHLCNQCLLLRIKYINFGKLLQNYIYRCCSLEAVYM
jgi:hypothetical protein